MQIIKDFRDFKSFICISYFIILKIFSLLDFRFSTLHHELSLIYNIHGRNGPIMRVKLAKVLIIMIIDLWNCTSLS